MKKITACFVLLCLAALLFGCGEKQKTQILATTKPVHQFTSYLCEGTPITVELLISENVSCLHDYTLQVSQMRKVEAAELIIINGAGFEEFLSDVLSGTSNVVDCSKNIVLHCAHQHQHEDHTHEADPHIWLSIANAIKMSENIYSGLCNAYPNYTDVFTVNLNKLRDKFAELDSKAQSLNTISCREIITFHDGFSYMAEEFGLNIIKAIEEESGSEASAQELIEIVKDIEDNNLPSIFTEVSSNGTAAAIIQNETNVKVYELDMALSKRSYFEAMEYNIRILKEALE